MFCRRRLQRWLFPLTFTVVIFSATVLSAQTSLENHSIAVRIKAQNDHLGSLHIVDRSSGRTLDVPEAFALVMKGGRILRASDLTVTRPLQAETLRVLPESPRLSDRKAGREACAELSDVASALRVTWCGILRAESPYFRQKLTLTADKDAVAIAEVRMIDIADAEARTVGTVKGSPLADGTMFFAFEHPLSISSVENGHAISTLPRILPLRSGESISYTSVIGVAPEGQMRRTFLQYLECERAHPYRPFLHYNSWYDIGFGDQQHGARYDNSEALDRIHAFGKELVEKRHATVDSFLFDDGWDDTATTWKFNPGFPDGFAPERLGAEKYDAGIGVWLSPWGGYDKEKGERVASGAKAGYEIANDGLALSGARYYRRFESVCMQMVEKYGVNFFKLDGTGNADQVFPGSEFDSDFSAAIHLISQLRQKQPDLFVNVTTGTQPSPFWLLYADSIWRGGEDHSFAGVGSERQRWITYRDGQTYKNVVQQAPLYPLNSLMLHGLIYAQNAIDLHSDPGHDFASEVHSYFGSGTQLQEMYITPSLLSTEDWDVLSESALWARRNADILKDTHWIGGDPVRLQIYGWAAWNIESHKGIVVLRNPSDKPREFRLNLQNAFELPPDAPHLYTATVPWRSASAKPAVMHSDRPVSVLLNPFEVRTLDMQPNASEIKVKGSAR